MNQCKQLASSTTIFSVLSTLILLSSSCSKDESKQQQLTPPPIVKETADQSCTDFDPNSIFGKMTQSLSGIFSTRPQNTDRLMAVIKLKTPALLTTSKIVNGVRTIDFAQLKKINDEQQEAISVLKKLSANVCTMYRYKMVLNAISVVAPIEVLEKLSTVGVVASWESSGSFERPRDMAEGLNVQTAVISERNSLKFVGAEKLHQMGISGQGMKIGILDTGIDFTHKMFGGVGTVEGYKAVDPSKLAAGYPSLKVVGGVDLVGTDYNSGSADYSNHIPKPDLNPIDEAGHGTHVAGTVAGVGDGVTSYDGMAKDASLFAIKVFGANGSTSDIVVIAGLEFSADPNGDGDLSDQLDVVNLSLGSGYGNPKILYAEAIKNLVLGGTVAVISAGNSGNKDYIVGAPGTATESLSVAASVDNGDHNWKYNSSEIILPTGSINVEAIEAATTIPVQSTNVVGDLVYMGVADVDFTQEQMDALKGKVAFIDRGVVSFNDKVKRAVMGGAIGVLVANNREEAPFKMGTTDKFNIPAIMITLDIGNKIKEAMKTSPVQIKFNSAVKIEKPELIDTLTDFSSKGPRSMDGYLKPEISAPGSEIISAEVGGGAAVVKMSGTSMAAPHMAGLMALIKQSMVQRGLNLTALELKNIAMGTAKTISENGKRYLISRQGSGRIQADVAAQAVMVASEPSISFGEISVESKKTVSSALQIKNLTKSDLKLSVVFDGNEFITMSAMADVVLKSESDLSLNFLFHLDATLMNDEYIREMDGWIKFMDGTTEVYRVPVLAIAHKLSAISSQSFIAQSGRADSAGAAASLLLANGNQNPGDALLFNLLATDERKPLSSVSMNADCDLQSVGYKIISKENEKNQIVQYIQFGIKIYKPVTTWHSCDVSILIDADGDGIAEQELLGSQLSNISGQTSAEFASTLLDATLARKIRKEFEENIEKVKENPIAVAALKDVENYNDAIIDQQSMMIYNNSNVVVVEAELKNLVTNQRGELQVQVVITHNEQSTVQMDDYLFDSDKKALKISVNPKDQPFINLPELLSFAADEIKTVTMTLGESEGSLLILYPLNRFTFADNIIDAGSEVLKPSYLK
jgi:minor extracellular serine protease Vpr